MTTNIKDQRKSQEAHDALEKAIEIAVFAGQTIAQHEVILRGRAKGMTYNKIAYLVQMPVAEVRWFAKTHAR